MRGSIGLRWGHFSAMMFSKAGNNSVDGPACVEGVIFFTCPRQFDGPQGPVPQLGEVGVGLIPYQLQISIMVTLPVKLFESIKNISHPMV